MRRTNDRERSAVSTSVNSLATLLSLREHRERRYLPR